ncbi:unnamed protein product [Haemonchus placei]|uniref:Uncharacterized protein n=1 Tax=Haemonchus placei TaxID=6290 RepID=A0A0N4WKK3_HAEPC|nr:unnamed protein product [Haemonchus placei]
MIACRAGPDVKTAHMGAPDLGQSLYLLVHHLVPRWLSQLEHWQLHFQMDSDPYGIPVRSQRYVQCSVSLFHQKLPFKCVYDKKTRSKQFGNVSSSGSL